MLSRKGLPITRKQIKRIALTIISVILIIIAVERTYNMNPEFHVDAQDASYYGIVEAKLTTSEKLEDFKYLYEVLEENYPFFEVNKRLHNVDWLGNRDKYKRIIRNTKNDAEFYAALDKILNDLNNGHVNVFDGRVYKMFYKSYYLYFANNSTNPYKYLSQYDVFSSPEVMYRYKFNGTQEELENVEVLGGDTKLETKILIPGKVAYMKFQKMGHYYTSKEDRKRIKEFLKEVEDYEKIILDIRGNTGGYDTYWEYIVSLLANKPLSYSYYSFFKDSHINTYKYGTFRITGLRSINLLDKETLSKIPDEVKNDFDYFKRYTISINPWSENINSEDYIDFKGKVYLLVDRNVFLSAERFAFFAKDSGFATLIGEPTGGDGPCEAIPFIYLPNSKFVIRFSRELGINSDGTINMEAKTTPHILVDPTPNEDFTKDACIQAAINDWINKDCNWYTSK